MLEKAKKAFKTAIKFLTPTRLFLIYYAKKHADMYLRLMELVDAPEHYKTDEKVKKDYFESLRLYGLPVKYYKEMGFYEIKDESRRDSFVMPAKLVAMWYGVNSGQSRKLLDNKVAFMETFSEYINRAWIYVRRNSFYEFIQFCIRYPKMLVKSANGSKGQGIHIFEYTGQSEDELTQIFQDLVKEDCLVEEFIRQTGIAHDLNPDSVNCVRICTMRFKDHVEIFQCFLKMGRGNVCVDNAGQGGIFAPIDVNTGIITRDATGQVWSEFPVHPVSGITIKGIKIPYWNEVKDLVINASEKVKDLVYVSWDVAVSDDGTLYLIEGNSCGDGMWLIEGGEWPVYKRAIKDHHRSLKYKLVYDYIIKCYTEELMSYMDL
jgi:hypothetical protein